MQWQSQTPRQIIDKVRQLSGIESHVITRATKSQDSASYWAMLDGIKYQAVILIVDAGKYAGQTLARLRAKHSLLSDRSHWETLLSFGEAGQKPVPERQQDS